MGFVLDHWPLNDCQFFQNFILFSNAVRYKCNILSETGPLQWVYICSVLRILMASCFSTRASVDTMLSIHPCVARCSWVNLQHWPYLLRSVGNDTMHFYKGQLELFLTEFFWENIKTFLSFLTFINIKNGWVVKILPPVLRKGPAFIITQSTQCLPKTWQHKVPGHHQPWSWCSSPRILWF